ncbi:MAG TPA: hypothetical protein VMF06_18040 [Candidatus Limnocylindria bacterium]|nr:hypothetical protein [Candidatus Limnocylindria bacterium]
MKTVLSSHPVLRWVSLLYAALSLACSLARAGNQRASATPLPSIYAFNVAAEATINLGTTTSLSWSVGDADTVTLSPGVGDVTGRTSANITPSETTTYVLTAKNAAGNVSKSKKITVIVPPVFQSLTAVPDSIASGGVAKLSWSAPGANYFSVVADNDIDPGNVFGNSVDVKPKTTTTYTVTAVNTAGTSVRTVTIPVTTAKPTIASFAASPGTVDTGAPVTLSWSVTNAKSLSISPGIGAVTGASVVVTPASNTTYTLTATNPKGSVTKAVSVKVTQVVAPVISSFTATPQAITSGQSVTLNWSVSGATKLSILANVGASPGVVTGSSVIVTPTASTTYTLTATNATGGVSKNVTVTVQPAAPAISIDSFAATPMRVNAGEAVSITWSVTHADSLWLSATAGGDPGSVTGKTNFIAHPLTTTRYALTAFSSQFGTVAKSLEVVVGPAPVPVIGAFTADPSTVAIGGSTTLRWSVSGADSLSVSADRGPSPGVVTGSSVVVTPVTNTTYTLTATNAFGRATQTVPVTVTGPTAPVIGSFFANPAFIQAGTTSILSWSVSGADSIAITADAGVSPGVVTGTSVKVTPATNTTYTLTATNAIGRTTATVPVAIYSPGSGSIVHPRILVTLPVVPQLNARAAANDPAWIKLRNDCDAYATMRVQFPDEDPTSNTINGGYQYNDYLQPSEELALGYLACKTADPVRAARYAAKERELLLKLSDPVHHGRPTTDSGYSIRSYVPALALGYDWIFETLSDSDRAQIYTEINRWVASYEATGFGRDFPQGNYFAGYYCAKALAALATEGENPQGPTMWNDWLNRVHYGMVQPYHAAWLSGGGAPDGWNYGQFETINMLRPIAAAFTAKGLDLIHDAKRFSYPDGHARWITQFTWPDMDAVSDRGFVYNDDNPTWTDAGWATQYGGLLRLANGDNAPLMQQYALELRAAQGTGNIEPWVEFLLHNNAAPAADYRTALSYATPGDGQVAMRSSWSQDAVWGAFQAGPYTGYDWSSEEFFDEGSLAIQRGSVQFLVNTWGALMRNTPGTSDGDPVFDDLYNELFQTQSDGVPSGRRIFNTYYAVRPGGYWGQVGNGPGDSNTTLSRFEEGGGYVLMRGANLESQYADDHPIGGWTRSVAFVRPGLFIVHDRTSLKNASADHWMAWHVAATPSEQSGAVAGTHRFDVIDTRAGFGGHLFRGRVTTVLPAGHRVNNVNVFNRGKVYRIEVRTAVPVAASTWLTVFDASASATAAGIAAPLSASAGNVLAGNIEGTLISTANATGSNVAVLFGTTSALVSGALSVALPVHDTYCLITDLLPNTGYKVLASSGNNGELVLQLAPGGTLQTTPAGTLPLNVSANGAVTRQ